MAFALSRGAAVRILDLQTLARLYTISEAEDVYGGRTYQTVLAGPVWGDFRPDAPEVEATADGDSYVVQTADFLCRSAVGAARGGVVQLKGFDWMIVSLDEGADGTMRLRLERVHA